MGEEDYKKRIEQRLQPFLEEMELAAQKRERELVEADPKKHQATTLMADHSRYRYWSGKNREKRRTVDGQERVHVSDVRFCWSTGRNIAGYYLAWREVIDSTTGEGRRDRWVAYKKRNLARSHAERAREIHDARGRGDDTDE